MNLDFPLYPASANVHLSHGNHLAYPFLPNTNVYCVGYNFITNR